MLRLQINGLRIGQVGALAEHPYWVGCGPTAPQPCAAQLESRSITMPNDVKRPIQILIVDDQSSVRAALRSGLESEGFVVSEATNKAGLLARLDRQPPINLITLDLMLGEEDGLKLAREVRSRRNVPIIMITALTHPIDRVTGLEHGADDYIVKPFHIREVLLRIHSVLRLYELERTSNEAQSEPDVAEELYECEIGVTDVRRREVRSPDGRLLELTDAEFDILVAFQRNPARVLSRDDLSMMLKGRQWSPTDRTLDGHIARLRKKIEPDIAAPRLIKTVWRVGYVFAGDVQKR
jgi:DNA-binding response OmpR family regulator